VSDLLLFIVVLGTLILGHELGHFLSSRLLGVRVEEFGIGYPPRLAKLFESGGTIFTINWIPFGGFNRLAGEDDPDVPGGFASASKSVRATILAAGPFANVLLAFLAFVLAFKFAAPDVEKVIISDLVEGAPAEMAGLLEGDLILAIEGKPITSFDSMLELISAHQGEPAKITIARDSQTLTIELIPRVEHPSDQGPIGATLSHPVKEMTWLEASRFGSESISLQVKAILGLPGRLIRGSVTPEETRVSGLKGIHDMLAWASSIDRASQRPFLTLNLIGVISLGFALANLLPFPALDGGRLIFVLIEALLGRRIAPRYEGLAHAIGFAILLALMVYINFQDFINPIQLPR
jgi:regulator of sigma E protease